MSRTPEGSLNPIGSCGQREIGEGGLRGLMATSPEIWQKYH